MLLSPKTADFADLWYASRTKADGAIPAKRDIPLRKLAPLMPWLIMHRRDESGQTFCHLFGTGLTELFGRDMTGSNLEEAMMLEDSTHRIESFRQYESEFGEGAAFCRYVVGQFVSRFGLHVRFESLAMPYIEEIDGSLRNLVHVLPLSTPDYGDSFTPHFREEKVMMFHPQEPRPSWLHAAPLSDSASQNT